MLSCWALVAAAACLLAQSALGERDYMAEAISGIDPPTYNKQANYDLPQQICAANISIPELIKCEKVIALKATTIDKAPDPIIKLSPDLKWVNVTRRNDEGCELMMGVKVSAQCILSS